MTWHVLKKAITRSALLVFLSAPAAHAAELATPVIPLPARVVVNKGSFSFDAGTAVVVRGGPEAERIARDFAARIERSRGFAPRITTDGKGRQAITLALDSRAKLPG